MAINGGQYNYDFKNYILNLGGQTISEGLISISVEYNSDASSNTVSTDGCVTRNRINDDSATITVVAKSSSPVNQILLETYLADRDAPNGLPLTLSLTNPETGHRFFADYAWIMNRPGLSLEQEISEREWQLSTNCLIETPGSVASVINQANL